MAKLEIPSIVVNNSGSTTTMEKTRSSKNRLSKQDEFDEVEEDPPADLMAMSVDKKECQWERREGTPRLEKSKSDPSALSTLSRQRSHPKVKLLQRSHALRDDTSPPPPDVEIVNSLSVSSTNTVTAQSKTNKLHKLGKQGSSQGSFEGSSPSLSRDSSIEQYSDSTGIDLNQFIVDTLHRSQKDRMMLMKIEQELNIFAKDNKRQFYRFPQMGSYQRMLVHRVAAYFGMDHNVDQSGTSVIVNKTKNTRLPDKRFRDQIRDELMPEEPKKSILKRDSSSFEEGKDLKSPERQLSSESRRSKSFEEREEEYEKARARIFNQDSSSSQEGPVDSPVRSHESTHNSSRRSSQEDLRWMTDARPWSSTDSDSSNRPAKLIITKTCASVESDVSLSVSRASQTLLMKTESADNRDALQLRSRPASVPKASSFGGISVLVRGDSMTSTRSATPRLTKADSFNASNGGASGCNPHRLSPSRVNSKVEATPAPPQPINTTTTAAAAAAATKSSLSVPSVNSTATSVPVLTNFTSTPTQTVNTTFTTASNSQQNSSQPVWTTSTMSGDMGPPNFTQGQPVMWAVSNMESVPPGSVLINPQTGNPYLNPDGSIYRHAPVTLPLAPPTTFPPVGNQLQPMVGSSQSQQSSMQPVAAPPVQLQHQSSSQNPLPMQTQPPHMPPLTLYSQLVNQPQTLHSEQRQFSLDGNTVNDLSNQLTNMSMSHLPTDSGGSGDGSQLMQATPVNQQGYFVRPAGLVANTQGNMPVYFVPPSVPPSQPVRVMYPVPYMSSMSQNQQQAHQSSSTMMSTQQQQAAQTPAQVPLPNVLDSQSHASSQSQITGGQYLQQGYPVVGYSQVSNHAGGDNFCISPYYSATTPSMASMGGGNSMSNFYSTPTSLVPNTPVNGGQVSTLSQTPFLTNNFSMYGGPLASITSSPALTPSSFSYTQGSYRPQTPPAQPNNAQGLSLGPSQSMPIPQSLPINPQYVGYPMFPHTSSSQMPPTTPTTPTPSQAALFPGYSQSVLSAAFPMFRSGMPLMTLRSSTPPPLVQAPPHGVMQTQYNNTAPMLTKSFSLPADHRFGKMGNEVYIADTLSLAGNPCQDNKNLALPTGTANVRPPTAPLFGRGIPVLQGDMRLLGPPLQQQLTTPLRASLVLPQQRMLTRFHNPQGISTGTNRPPKVRKQRSKASSSKLDTAILTTQASVDLPENSWGHILEVQSLPEGLKRSEVDRYLEEVTTFGGKLQFLGEESERSGSNSNAGSDYSVVGKCQVLAVFASDTDAQSALVNIKTNKFELRLLSSKPPS